LNDFKNKVGLSCTGFVKICNKYPSSSASTISQLLFHLDPPSSFSYGLPVVLESPDNTYEVEQTKNSTPLALIDLSF
jgi:hypothetical protein